MEYYRQFSKEKSDFLYDFIDNSGFYSNPVDKKCRSRMNIPFRVNMDEALEKKFVVEADKEGLIELKGHRMVGGCRASLYNAMPMEGVKALVNFMERFMKENRK